MQRNPFPTRLTPRLLVSVRSLKEARVAARCGVDIIDVKDPDQGSLGRASSEVMASIVEELAPHLPAGRISAACGEALEWLTPGTPPPPVVPVPLLKLGTAGLGPLPDWRAAWQEARNRAVPPADSPVTNQPRWIAVAYVDVPLARSPAVEEVIAAAAELRCSGVLFDTYSKSAGRLFDWTNSTRLRKWSRDLRASGLFSAAAGKVAASDLPPLCETGVDVIGVRSAACRDGNRQAEISESAIRRLMDSLHQTVTGSRVLNREQKSDDVDSARGGQPIVACREPSA